MKRVNRWTDGWTEGRKNGWIYTKKDGRKKRENADRWLEDRIMDRVAGRCQFKR